MNTWGGGAWGSQIFGVSPLSAVFDKDLSQTLAFTQAAPIWRGSLYLSFQTANFGPSMSGLSTVGYTVLGYLRSTDDIIEIAPGIYRASVSLPDEYQGNILWDTGGDSPAYAVEDIYPQPVDIDGFKQMAARAGLNVTEALEICTFILNSFLSGTQIILPKSNTQLEHVPRIIFP